jgi:hypothetical protein
MISWVSSSAGKQGVGQASKTVRPAGPEEQQGRQESSAGRQAGKAGLQFWQASISERSEGLEGQQG